MCFGDVVKSLKFSIDRGVSLFGMQVYGLIISAYRVCTRFYDPGKWLLSAQVH